MNPLKKSLKCIEIRSKINVKPPNLNLPHPNIFWLYSSASTADLHASVDVQVCYGIVERLYANDQIHRNIMTQDTYKHPHSHTHTHSTDTLPLPHTKTHA